MNFRDVEVLSAYLDGQLSPSEAARLEARLSSDPSLKATLEDLRQTRTLLRKLPQRRAPRNFRLSPKMAGLRPPEPRAYPAFRLATALAALLFLGSVAVNALTPFAARHLAAAPAPSLGLGGGGGGGGYGGAPPAAGPYATEAPAGTQAPQLAAPVPTVTPESLLSTTQATAAPPVEDTTRTAAGAPTAAANKAAPTVQTTAGAQGQLPVPVPWVAGLGAAVLIFAVAAWLLRRNSDRRFRERWNQK